MEVGDYQDLIVYTLAAAILSRETGYDGVPITNTFMIGTCSPSSSSTTEAA
jgi:hypothetical protein